MAGNFQHLELGTEKIPARRFFDKKVRVRRLDFEFETEAAKKFSIRNHRRSERVTADWTIELPLDPGDILHVIDVSVPYPRDLNAAVVADLRAKLWDQVREESLKAMGGRL